MGTKSAVGHRWKIPDPSPTRVAEWSADEVPQESAKVLPILLISEPTLEVDDLGLLEDDRLPVVVDKGLEESCACPGE